MQQRAAVHFPHLAERVASQRTELPEMYGDVDFDRLPYRLATSPDDESALPRWAARREDVLADDRLVELVTTTTMLGDVVADAYAALLGRYPLRELISMLRMACRQGLDAVDDPPVELVRLIEAMEATPDWIDLDLVERGAKESRVRTAYLSPLLIRGAFLGTFMNTYSALPMALTGQLSGTRAARRVHETASFFTVSTLPGALHRHGAGFEAAAMVRLMHSMVRLHALRRSDRWDVDVYGVPVPQIDQMPAGYINLYLLAAQMKRKGRTEFTAAERAIVEFGRYRCFLLGLPEELTPITRDEILHLFHGYGALLRDGFDDDTCGALVRSTMDAYLRKHRTPVDLVLDEIEKSYSKAFFVQGFAGGSRKKAKRMGVSFGPDDLVRIAATVPFVVGRLTAMETASKLPVVGTLTDVWTVGVIKRQLASYGKPEFTSDHTSYEPVSA